MMIIHYEVYVQEPRGWMLHARYPRQERENALAEAKELEQIHLKVKVVRETYYSDTNNFEEAEIYHTGKGQGPDRGAKPPAPAPAPPPRKAADNKPAAKPKPPIKRPARRSKAAPPRPSLRTEKNPDKDKDKAPSAPEPAPAATPSADDAQEAARPLTLVVRLVIILAIALGAALGAVRLTPNVVSSLWKVGLATSVNAGNFNQILFAVFSLTFLMVAVPLALRYLPRRTSSRARNRMAAAAAQAEADRAALDAQRQRKVRKSLDRLAREALAEEERATAVAELLEDKEESAEETETKPKDSPADDNRQSVEAPADTGPTPENRRAVIMRFLNGAVTTASHAVPTLDSYNKFALHLYLAGAVDGLCDAHGTGDGDRRTLTAATLEALGTPPDLARHFYDKIGSYLLEQRYLKMAQAGRTAIESFLGGAEAGAHVVLKDALTEWNKPAQKQSLVVTVMFTDMVGSTDLTQARGDAAAQEIVRRHNAIVRTAILQCDGKEVKHTGDGIMASFASAAKAVDAAAAIQRNVAAHNAKMPAQELHLRIGLNAGEPIQEENDLFGSTVQLAARVCAATPTDGILCTETVKTMAHGKGNAFQSAGNHALKGFRDPVPLYEIAWARP